MLSARPPSTFVSPAIADGIPPRVNGAAIRLGVKGLSTGLAKEQVVVIDGDLSLSGSGSVKQSGFAQMTAPVAQCHGAIVLGLEVGTEVSRLARNNAYRYRLLDLHGIPPSIKCSPILCMLALALTGSVAVSVLN